jgi:MFS family permease
MGGAEVRGPETASASSSLFGPLRNRSYSLLFAGQAVSGLGNGMYTIILAWTVYSVTGSSADMGGVLIVNIIPQIVLAIYGGALADRLSRRGIILTSNVGAGVVTSAMSFAVGSHKIGTAVLIIGSFSLGVASAFFSPAFGSIFKDILEPSELRAGNALRGMTMDVIRLVSPALGGIVYSYSGARLGFGLDAGSFYFAALTAGFARVPQRTMQSGKRLIRQMREGFSYIFSTPWLVAIIVIALLANTMCIAPMEVLLALVVRQSHEGSWFLGLALSVQASVAAAGSAIVGRSGWRIRPGIAFYSLAIIMALGVAVVGLSLGPVTIMLGVMLVGAGFTFSVIEETVLQKYVANEYLGRVYSVGTLAAYSLLPVGYALAGIGAGKLGAGPVLVIGGTIGAVAGILGFAMARRSGQSVLFGDSI